MRVVTVNRDLLLTLLQTHIDPTNYCFYCPARHGTCGGRAQGRASCLETRYRLLTEGVEATDRN